MSPILSIPGGTVKLTIKDILQGTYVQESEQNPNYLLTEYNQKVYRLNVIAAVLHLQKIGSLTNILIEDGTGQIVVRFFEEQKLLSHLTPGSVIVVVGKLRMYNQEKYISPEICKQVNPLWLKVRSLEIHNPLSKPSLFLSKQESTSPPHHEEIKIYREKIVELIKQLDTGAGA
ncbi:MAG: OB-fold nucleic acid binding domain-containing protein, partial [Nanoarchaeota archaeon]